MSLQKFVATLGFGSVLAALTRSANVAHASAVFAQLPTRSATDGDAFSNAGNRDEEQLRSGPAI